MAPRHISAGEEGCPYVNVRENGIYFHARLSSCPTNNSKCPEWNHTGYWTDEIYRYPSCLMNVTDRFAEPWKDGSTVDNGRDSDMHFLKEQYILIVCVLMSSGFAVGGTFIIIVVMSKRWEKKRLKGFLERPEELIPLNEFDRMWNHFVLLKTIAESNNDNIESVTGEMSCLKKPRDEKCEYCKITSPLIFAAQSGKEACVKHLEEVMPILDVQDNFELNLIHYCVIYDWSEIFLAALRKCPELLHENENKNGKSSILSTSKEEEKAILKMAQNAEYRIEQDFWQNYREQVLQRGQDVLPKLNHRKE